MNPEYTPNNSTSTALGTALIVKATASADLPAVFFGASIYNNGAAQYIQVHDSATVPANGAVPVLVYRVPGTANVSIDMGKYGRRFTSGITFTNSTTVGTLGIGAADCWFDVQYL